MNAINDNCKYQEDRPGKIFLIADSFTTSPGHDKRKGTGQGEKQIRDADATAGEKVELFGEDGYVK
ncbi:hypothetical protein [uncultured Clostridium sp.]|uniref:hypothetical protein n=1 Tax=uncultured Clostridium sp. TaxID=59620 RepID=UPI0025F88C06|nr:hypothetical protein [uncultured Clostridium sp.]